MPLSFVMDPYRTHPSLVPRFARNQRTSLGRDMSSNWQANIRDGSSFAMLDLGAS